MEIPNNAVVFNREITTMLFQKMPYFHFGFKLSRVTIYWSLFKGCVKSKEILQNKSIYAKYYECPCCWLSNFKYVAGNPVRIPELSRSRLFLICLICQIRGPAADELTKSLLTNSAILLPNADSFFSLKLSRQYSTLIGEKNAMLPKKKTWIFNELSISIVNFYNLVIEYTCYLTSIIL